MFKILYILFFIALILFLQYFLNKPETFNISNRDEIALTVRQSDNSGITDTDHCTDFNHLVQNYSSCCETSEKEKGCRRPLCEKAHDLYNEKVNQNTELQNQNTTLQNSSNNLQSQNTTLQSQNSDLQSELNSITDYMEYPGVLSLGNSSQLLNIPGADGNGCLDNISIQTAKNTCDDSTDCNSFFSYDPNSNAKVCFKSAYGQSGEITSGSADNSFFVKVPTAVSSPTGSPIGTAVSSPTGSPIS